MVNCWQHGASGAGRGHHARRITDRVVAINGHPGIRPMMTLTLSSDHRVIDGARAAEFLRDLVAAICDPRRYLSQSVVAG